MDSLDPMQSAPAACYCGSWESRRGTDLGSLSISKHSFTARIFGRGWFWQEAARALCQEAWIPMDYRRARAQLPLHYLSA